MNLTLFFHVMLVLYSAGSATHFHLCIKSDFVHSVKSYLKHCLIFSVKYLSNRDCCIYIYIFNYLFLFRRITSTNPPANVTLLSSLEEDSNC